MQFHTFISSNKTHYLNIVNMLIVAIFKLLSLQDCLQATLKPLKTLKNLCFCLSVFINISLSCFLVFSLRKDQYLRGSSTTYATIQLPTNHQVQYCLLHFFCLVFYEHAPYISLKDNLPCFIRSICLMNQILFTAQIFYTNQMQQFATTSSATSVSAVSQAGRGQ